jgi:CMP-N-acetylneuraminic acid synthetase
MGPKSGGFAMKPSVCAIIPARAGSKGLPGKNLKHLNGAPLLVHSIQHAWDARCIDRIFLSTDCKDMAHVGIEHGAEVPVLRPKSLAGDTSPVVDAVEHLLGNISNYTPDYVALLQPTSPLRTGEDIDRAFSKLQSNDLPAVVSVCEAKSHPLLCKQMDSVGRMEPYVENELNGARRQELPPAFELNGALYIVRTVDLLKTRSWCPKGAGAYEMPQDRSVDIDTEMDFKWAEWLMLRHQEVKAA